MKINMTNIHCACIKWDQKLGGVVEAVYPNLRITPNSAMNIYNLHRMRQTGPSFGSIRLSLEGGEKFNVASFFSGFGYTSPDGFTGTTGKNAIGIAEKVFCLFLPMDVKSQAYEEILARVSARMLTNINKISDRVKEIQKLIEMSALVKKPEELLEFLEKNLDRKLGIKGDELANANFYEVKALHYMVLDKREHIKELTINPAQTAFCIEEDKIAKANTNQQEIKDLIAKVQNVSSQKDITEAVSSQKDEMIEQLKMDYVKIFGTLTDQIMQLENEIKGISESTQAFVTDLNTALAQKIGKISELEEELQQLKLEKS
jgi:hypothetical protein